jgi:hypothetical protein
MWTIIAAIVGFIVVFIVWRVLSVPLGMEKRDKELWARLDPLLRKLESIEPAEGEVAQLAEAPENRYLLFELLREHEKTDLMPDAYASSVHQGESALCYWMMHPNELQAAPAAIEHLQTRTETVGGQPREFHVYRYKMPEGHWAGENWILGIAGPMNDTLEPYSELPGAFSVVAESLKKRDPNELIDWYIDMLRQRGLMDEE